MVMWSRQTEESEGESEGESESKERDIGRRSNTEQKAVCVLPTYVTLVYHSTFNTPVKLINRKSRVYGSPGRCI